MLCEMGTGDWGISDASELAFRRYENQSVESFWLYLASGFWQGVTRAHKERERPDENSWTEEISIIFIWWKKEMRRYEENAALTVQMHWVKEKE